MRLRSPIVFFAGVLLMCTSAGAGTLYGVSNGFTVPSDNTVYEIDPATGSISNTVQITLPGFTLTHTFALAAHPATGVLHAVVQASGGGGRRLVTLDPATGVAALIGSLPNAISSLAFKSDGTLLGVSGDGGTPPETLYSISTTNGALTLLFALGNGDYGESIAMHPNGLLYHSSGHLPSEFESIDLATQVVTPIASGLNDNEPFAMGYSTTLSQMFLSDYFGDLYRVNVANGFRTFVGAIPSISLNRGLAFVEGTPATPFCTGDAPGVTCLGCGNHGSPGRGCRNSSFPAGALLTVSGFASVTPANDTLVLTCSSMTGPGLFFQADGINAPFTFGDGMLCASTNIIRMGVVFPTGGSASYPGGLTPNPIHIAGGPISAGQTKHYQCWYRDAAEILPGVSYCTPATFNLSNGVSLVWGS